jgi:uncharacterized membrane protein
MNTRPLLILTIGLVAVEFALSAIAWLQLPAGAEVPIHWDISGEPDGYAPAALALLLTPGITLLLGLLLAVAPRFDPRRENLVRSRPAYLWITGSALVMTGVLHALVVLAALGSEIDVVLVIALMTGALFVVIGNFLQKTRSSWFMGIRTPWTLSSERSWTETHRLGGYAFMAVGVASALAAVVAGPEVFFWILLGGIGVSVVGLFVYSYLVWRDDPDRRTL